MAQNDIAMTVVFEHKYVTNALKEAWANQIAIVQSPKQWDILDAHIQMVSS